MKKSIIHKVEQDGYENEYVFFCPGCKGEHPFNTTSWMFNGDFNKPTISPSLLCTRSKDNDYRCHSYIKEGQIQFLSDCSHDLKGKTVPLEPF